jgi:hypothetical protein
LTVSTEPSGASELARFVEQAPPREQDIEQEWRALRGKDKPTLAECIEQTRADQPLSFASFVPEPPQRVYDQMVEDSKTTCRLCGGKGKRPTTQQEADALGVQFYPGVVPDLPLDERQDCNGCQGSGREPAFGAGWYEWRLEHWGSKWDASFNGPMGAICAEDADVELTVETQGVTNAQSVVIYKFDTAWSPPVEAVKAMSYQFPELSFRLRFAEAGNGIAGQVDFISGLCVEETELEVDEVLAPEEMWF